jgi:hypothetical protein
MEVKNFNNFENMTITKNEDGMYHIKGQTDGRGYVEIFSAKVKLVVEVVNPEDGETMMAITYEQ